MTCCAPVTNSSVDRLVTFGAGASVFSDMAAPSTARAGISDAVLQICLLWENEFFQNIQYNQCGYNASCAVKALTQGDLSENDDV